MLFQQQRQRKVKHSTRGCQRGKGQRDSLCAPTCIYSNLFEQQLKNPVSEPCLHRSSSVSSAVSTCIDYMGLRATLERALVTLVREKEAKLSLF